MVSGRFTASYPTVSHSIEKALCKLSLENLVESVYRVIYHDSWYSFPNALLLSSYSNTIGRVSSTRYGRPWSHWNILECGRAFYSPFRSSMIGWVFIYLFICLPFYLRMTSVTMKLGAAICVLTLLTFRRKKTLVYKEPHGERVLSHF